MSNHVQFSLRILPVVLGIFMIFSIMKLEKIFFPIVQNFQYTKLYRTVTRIEAEGHYILNRDCELVGGDYFAINSNGKRIELSERRVKIFTQKYLPDGTTDFGEWEISYSPEANHRQIEFTGYYKCHPFWLNEVRLYGFIAPKPIIDKDGEFHDDEINKNLLLTIQPS